MLSEHGLSEIMDGVVNPAREGWHRKLLTANGLSASENRHPRMWRSTQVAIDASHVPGDRESGRVTRAM